VTAAALLACLSLIVLNAPALAQSGALDTTFGADGKVTTDFDSRWSAFDESWDVALQTDGKIVAAGKTGGSGRFALARYHMDGTLDHSFGGDGKVTTNFSWGEDVARGVTVQTDGKIVVAGDSAGHGFANSMFAVSRYNPDGTLDTSFGGDGKVRTQLSALNDYVGGLALQSDGRIVVAGGARLNGAHPQFAVTRYNVDGTLDASFSGDGKATTDLTSGNDFANAVTVDTDGSLILGGSAWPRGRAKGGSRFAMVRYTPQGTLDASFGGDGKVLTKLTRRNDSVQDVAVQTDGKIVAAGVAGFREELQTMFGDASVALTRYNADGKLDKGFGRNGKVKTQLTRRVDAAFGVGLQGDGKIVVGGLAGGSRGGRRGRFGLARYETDGTLDTAFGSAGRVTTSFTARGDFASSIVIQTDGRIVLAGVSRWASPKSRFALARYLAP